MSEIEFAHEQVCVCVCLRISRCLVSFLSSFYLSYLISACSSGALLAKVQVGMGNAGSIRIQPSDDSATKFKVIKLFSETVQDAVDVVVGMYMFPLPFCC